MLLFSQHAQRGFRLRLSMLASRFSFAHTACHARSNRSHGRTGESLFRRRKAKTPPAQQIAAALHARGLNRSTTRSQQRLHLLLATQGEANCSRTEQHHSSHRRFWHRRGCP